MLVPIREEDGFVLDIRCATADNVARRALYASPAALLLPRAYALLTNANTRARALGLRLRIFDAFRPVEAQWALWHAIPDKRFVADPRQGGLHPRGAAVDLTLDDAASGQSLPMGTGFDAMTERSAHDSLEVPAEAQRNRAMLLGLMAGAGWEHYRLEWWHYHLSGAERHPPLCAAAVSGGPL